ncbi:hypothetical protein Leryth_023757 [Lithospermum erythrorhizon]|nr:hypothetical protein Leryth_023757 [Lithospermum erythrorhizon]
MQPFIINILHIYPKREKTNTKTHSSNLRKIMDHSLCFKFILITFMVFSSSVISMCDCLCPSGYPSHGVPIDCRDIDLMQFAVNLEHLECEYFLYGSLGYGLDKVAPELTWGGPPPIGAQKANLDFVSRKIIEEFGYQEVGHLRALKTTVGGFPRPLLDLSAKNFAELFNSAFGYELDPPFDPYRDSISYMLASYVIPYMGLLGYVGTNPNINGYITKRLLAGLLGVEAGQDAVIRHYLYERATKAVHPYNYTVAEFTIKISNFRNQLAMCGIRDEGIIVPRELGAENRTKSNVLSANYNSLSYRRTPREILRVVYSTGNESVPGGFFPKGASGRIAQKYLYLNDDGLEDSFTNY